MDFIQILHLIKFIWESSMKVNFDSGDFNLAHCTGKPFILVMIYHRISWIYSCQRKCSAVATSRQFFTCASCQVWSLWWIFLPMHRTWEKWMGILGTWLVVCPLKLATSGLFQQNCTLSNLPKIIRSTGVRTPHQNKSKGEVSRVNRGSAPASTANTSGLSVNIDSETKYLF